MRMVKIISIQHLLSFGDKLSLKLHRISLSLIHERFFSCVLFVVITVFKSCLEKHFFKSLRNCTTFKDACWVVQDLADFKNSQTRKLVSKCAIRLVNLLHCSYFFLIESMSKNLILISWVSFLERF